MTVEQSGMDSLIKYNNPQVLSCIQKTILKKRSKWKCLELAEFHGLEFPPISLSAIGNPLILIPGFLIFFSDPQEIGNKLVSSCKKSQFKSPRKLSV